MAEDVRRPPQVLVRIQATAGSSEPTTGWGPERHRDVGGEERQRRPAEPLMNDASP